ncbi:hypothetical protein RB653_007327 [Dictyostelium firmibasis]|uniref:Sacsin/Nov domain-containing protein n=1 Tax=Dictyostelium firmibasis TaxID=79012 RepID=A0AAN7YR59_9MYCE
MPKFKDQSIKLSHFLRDNLLNYPESKIFRELIQNAEDAQADSVIIKVDESIYGNNGLLISEDKKEIKNSFELLGPSILIYNNAIFQEKDWGGICQISQGSKKENLKSVGNFGLGWNSVYHITDNPIVFSGHYVWFSDPNERMGGGLFFDLRDQNDLDSCKSFLEPFINFKEANWNPCSSFLNGTIIRLPLRLYSSEIKSTILTMDAIKGILDEFSKDINEILIFLKNISSIVIIVNDQVVNSVSISNLSEIKKQRGKVFLFLSNIVDKEMKNPSSAIEFAEILCQKNQLDCESIFQINFKISKNGVTENISYLVSQGIFIDKKLIDLVKKNKEIKLISYGGTAIPIDSGTSTKFKGKPFTFLPIGSLVYDIPLHVNGYFRLSNARDNIIYSLSEVEEASESLSKQWNMFVSEAIIPYFYLKSLDYMKLYYGRELYNYFPYRCNIKSLQGSNPSYDISINTMNSIVNGTYFLDHFNSSQYLALEGSLIISNDQMPPDFVLTILDQRKVKTIKLPSELLNHFNNLKIPLQSYSKLFLCNLLVSCPLTNYSEDVIDYLFCSEIIDGGHLDKVKILPIDSSYSTLGCLYKPPKLIFCHFIYMSDQVHDILFKYDATLTFHLKLSALPNNFRKSVTSICRVYNNIHQINLSEFITKLHTFRNQFLIQNVEKIWDCIDELKRNENLQLDQIKSLHIVQYRKSSTQFGVTCYNNSLLLMYNSQFLGIEPILNELNIYLVKENHQFNCFLAHISQYSQLLNYLQNARWLLKPNDIDIIRNFLINLDPFLSPKDISIFYELPIHPCLGNSNKKFGNISKTSMCVDYINIDKYEIHGKELIKITELSQHKNLLKQSPSSSKLMLDSEKKVFRYYLIPNISQFKLEVSIKIINRFLTHYSIYYNEDNLLKKIAFIPSENGVYSTPDSFYIMTLSEKKLVREIFPHIIIHPLIKIENLKNFGLKDKLPFTSICPRIPNLLSKEYSIETYKNFMECLVEKGDDINDSIINSLKDIPFIPASEVDTYDGYEPTNSKISLSESTLSIHKDCSFTLHYPIKGIEKNNPLHKYLSSTCKKFIIDHLLNLNFDVSNYETTFNPASVFNSTYNEINLLIKKKQLEDQMDRISEIEWIWLDEELVPTKNTFTKNVNPNLNFKPYFNFIKLFHNTKFLDSLKLKQEPTLEDYIGLINSIQDNYNKENSNSDELLNLVVYCLQLNIFNREIIEKSKIKLPTVDREFVEFEKVVFVDHKFLPTEFKDSGYFELHHSISINTVSRLKISKVSQLICQKVAFDHQFGQKEELVPRLKQILHDYNVNTFLNEMVQNAHDAGSTEVKLILDCNSHIQKYLEYEPKEFDEFQQDLQSYFESSLLFYNNSFFKEKDIINVQKMSGSIKKQDKSSIGQYGLGINSMYTFSDCPCILSGEYLMVFDPLVSHIGQSVDYSPGAKYKIQEYKNYPKFFEPFEHLQSILGFNLDDGRINGTIIRLPLRKKLNGNRFISPQIWNEDKVFDYLKSVVKCRLENLMFFTNIDSLDVLKLESQSSKLEIVISIEKRSSHSLITNQFNNLIPIPTQASEYTFTIKHSEKHKITEKYIIGQVSEEEFNLSEYPSNNALKFLSMYNTGKRKPVGGIAFKIPDFNNSYKFQAKSFCYLPFKDLISDIPVHLHGHFSTTSSRDILESTKSTKLFNLDKILSEKVGSDKEQSDDFELCWNEILVTDVIAPIYINTLTLFKNKFIKGNDIDLITKYHDFYYSLFPKKGDRLEGHFIIGKLIEKFYSLVESEGSDVFLHCPSVEIKKNPNDTLNIDFGFFESYDSLSILKCIDYLNFNVKIATPSLIACFSYLNKRNLTKERISRELKRKDLDPKIITTEDIGNIISFFFSRHSPQLLDNCQVLVFNDQTRDFVSLENISDINNKNKHQLYNPTHLDFGEKLGLKFIDSKLTNILKNLPSQTSSLSDINIYDFNYVDFYFYHLLPNFNKLPFEDNIILLKKLLEFFETKNDTIKEVKHELISSKQLHILKTSNVFPFVNKDGVQEFTLISKLFNPKFIKYDFTLNYPILEVSKGNIDILKYLGIKNELNKDDIVSQFKKISSDAYREETPIDTLIKRARYLWKLNKTAKAFDELVDLNIVPVKESEKIGGKKMKLKLLSINNTCHSDYEDLYFSVKLIQDVEIPYPKLYNHIDYQKIFENFVSLLSNITDWPKTQNGKIDPEIFRLLASMCHHLERYQGDFSKEMVERILRIPVVGSDSFIDFNNVVITTESSNLKPFFNVLPQIFHPFKTFFSKLGVKELSVDIICQRLNTFLHQEITHSEGNRSLGILYELLFNFEELETYKIKHSPLPVFTKKGFIKPSNEVYLFDLSVSRIKTNSIYQINESIKKEYEKLGVLKLSSSLREELDDQMTDLDDDSLDDSIAQFLNTLIKENQKFISKLHKHNLSEILNIKVKSGTICTNFFYKGENITKDTNCEYFNDRVNSILYIDRCTEKEDAFRKLLKFNSIDVTCSVFNSFKKKFFCDKINSQTSQSINYFEDNNLQNSQTEHQRTVNCLSDSFKTIARRNSDIASILKTDPRFNRECMFHYLISIEMSLKSLLVFHFHQPINSNSVNHLSVLLSKKIENVPYIPKHLEKYKKSHLANDPISHTDFAQIIEICSQLLILTGNTNNN